MQGKRKIDLFKYSHEPDRELLMWEEWIKIRKEETTKLAQKLKRQPADLVMNLVETVREDKEIKTVLEHAQISKKPGIRGSLWEQPQRLKQDCYGDPVYEIQRTSAEMGRPSVIEHIGVPQYILKTEKCMEGEIERIACNKLDKEYQKYREKREKDLKDKIKKLDPFRADTSKLMIKGSKPKPPPKKMRPLPIISIIPDGKSTDDLIESFYAIRINNTVLFNDIPGQSLSHFKKMQQASWHEGCTSWHYYFNTPVQRVGRSKLFLQNLGTVTLRYCWKKIQKSIPFIPEENYTQVFFFNKNEDVLSPGQSRLLCFTFVSEKPGIFNEIWELHFCNICFFDTLANTLVINLDADAVEDFATTNRKIEILKSKIDRKAVYNFMNQLLNDIVTKAMSFEHKLYSYKKMFLEADLFLMKNPVCFYHQTEVMNMKEIYTEMMPGKIWDLSITSWREAMMNNEYEERIKYYEILRISHAELLKPWYENEDLMTQKYRMIKLLLGQMADKFEEEYDRLSNMYCSISGTAINRDTTSRPQYNIAQSKTSMYPFTSPNIKNIFYIHAYDHVATTIEMCVGVLSSLDLNRWIQFDFCH